LSPEPASVAQVEADGLNASRATSGLLVEAGRELAALGRNAIESAGVELSMAAARTRGAIVWVALGLLMVTGGFYAIIGGVVFLAVRLGAPHWAGALGVGVVLVAVGAMVAKSAVTRVTSAQWVPAKTIRTVKETVQSMTAQITR